MKTAVFYYSYHHGNTLKVLQAMQEKGNMALFNLAQDVPTNLEDYDLIGFASGIYGMECHKKVVEFAQQHLPSKKPVFFVYTYGVSKGTGAKALSQVAAEKEAPVLGEFSCRGFDTFGPLQWVGGVAKGHPNAQDLQNAQEFYQAIRKEF